MRRKWRSRFLRTQILALAYLIPLETLPAQFNPNFDTAWQDIREFYTTSLRENGIVGSSLMFVQEGKAIGRQFYGHADKEEQRLVDENTIYHWASITKTFTGIAIMQLRDRGLLKLDDPIVKYIPELKAVHNPFGGMGEITIRHLMTHSAGFRAPTWPWGGDEDWHPHEPMHWQQVVAMFPYTEIRFEPGSRYSYSNPGIIFLGRVIELITRDDFEVYIDKNILKPLHMYSSYFDHTPYHLLKHRSNNYYVTEGKLKANGLDFNTGITVSNGGLNAPLTDMAKYMSFLLGDPARQEVYDGVLKRSSLEEMWLTQIEIGGNKDQEDSSGLIFFLVDLNGLRFVGHTGSQKAFISFFFFEPRSRTGCIAAFNTLGISADGEPHPDTRALARELRLKIFDEVFPLFRE
jgi:CubicO group peptidase (beta-lactamase class C family)